MNAYLLDLCCTNGKNFFLKSFIWCFLGVHTLITLAQKCTWLVFKILTKGQKKAAGPYNETATKVKVQIF